MTTAWAVMVLLLSDVAKTAEVLALDVMRDANRYRINVHAVLAAMPDRIIDVLTDFDRLDRLSSQITSSQRLPAQPPFDARVKTTMKTCVLVHCIVIRRVEDVLVEPRRLVTRIVPELSDFNSGWAQWQLISFGEGVHLSYRSELDPTLSLPPVIGPMVLKRRMQDDLVVALTRLEDLATAE